MKVSVPNRDRCHRKVVLWCLQNIAPCAALEVFLHRQNRLCFPSQQGIQRNDGRDRFVLFLLYLSTCKLSQKSNKQKKQFIHFVQCWPHPVCSEITQTRLFSFFLFGLTPRKNENFSTDRLWMNEAEVGKSHCGHSVLSSKLATIGLHWLGMVSTKFLVFSGGRAKIKK
jgi:hypothetical protein